MFGLISKYKYLPWLKDIFLLKDVYKLFLKKCFVFLQWNWLVDSLLARYDIIFSVTKGATLNMKGWELVNLVVSTKLILCFD